MKAKTKYFHCGEQLQKTLAREINEVEAVISKVQWFPSVQYNENGNTYEYQTGYNKALSAEFNNLDWEPQPLLRINPKLIGDFRRGLVFVEIQFGNSSTLYRDYYKFQYGLANGLLSLADNYLTVLSINVPVMLVGLLPEN